jgi:pilus assembly protein CpaC
MSRLINTRLPCRTVDVTQPDVVLAKIISATDILVTGKKPGSCQLLLWDELGHSQSVDILVGADLDALQMQFKKLLPNNPIDVSMAEGSIVLRGRVPSAQSADQAVQLATPYGQKVINLLEVSGGQQVTLQVRFAEVSRSASTALGVNFGVASGGGFGASTIGQVAPFGITNAQNSTVPILGVPSPGPTVTGFGRGVIGATTFDLFISALRENNLLRVLAEPSLTTLSGQEASFLAGGEIPIPVPQTGGGANGSYVITVDYKKFGVRLTFVPVVLGDGRIRLKVTPEVSDLDNTHSITNAGFQIPAFTTRTATTTVELNEGQTLSLAGLLNNRVNTSSQVTPLLGDLPIIGTLFRSVRYDRQETELVVLVTPHLTSGMNPGQVPELPGEHWRYPTESELFWHRDLGGPAPEVGRTPSTVAPPQFHGTYGFAPAAKQATASEGK